MGFKDVKGLNDISNGVVEEQFAKEWETVLFNIADPSTEPKAKRKITIEISISPNENRSTAVVSMKTKSSLAPTRGDESMIQMELRNEGVVAYAFSDDDEKQMELDEGGKEVHLERKA